MTLIKGIRIKAVFLVTYRLTHSASYYPIIKDIKHKMYSILETKNNYLQLVETHNDTQIKEKNDMSSV